ncbi:hypothetical protein [Roseivivax sp. THAF197b]|uniref:hypothetical protein n=1 Tax=Roseivivax sp. THAF197b TaxID=2588299 RepID=UPI001267C83C|nr:hypothetical protein [Roseivivax sp. THAF197b]QFS82341.1 hypothetical protein FIV09_05835 [Roseivivax sp. THAF197b]
MTAPFSGRFTIDTLDNETAPERRLWASVLLALIEDAVFGAPACLGTPGLRIVETRKAREYFLAPNDSLRAICELLGLDPVAVRDRVARQIEAAETPEVLISKPVRHSPRATPTRRRAKDAGGACGLSTDPRDRRGKALTPSPVFALGKTAEFRFFH